MNLKKSVRSLVRLIPAFGAIALFGGLTGLILHVPLDDMGVVIGVPLTVLFILSRLAVLAVPRSIPEDLAEQNPHKKAKAIDVPNTVVTPLFTCGATSLTLGAVFALVAFLTAGGYRVLDLSLYAHLAIRFGFACLSVSGIGLILLLAEEIIDARGAKIFLHLSIKKEIDWFWKLLRSPGILAKILPGGLGDVAPNHR